jgi:hypothetical protein
VGGLAVLRVPATVAVGALLPRLGPRLGRTGRLALAAGNARRVPVTRRSVQRPTGRKTNRLDAWNSRRFDTTMWTTCAKATAVPRTPTTAMGIDPAEAFCRIVDAAHNTARSWSPAPSTPAGFDTMMPKTLATATVDRLLRSRPPGADQGRQPPPRRGSRRKGSDPLELTNPAGDPVTTHPENLAPGDDLVTDWHVAAWSFVDCDS